MDDIRYKDGYKQHLRSIKKKKNYQMRQKKKIKRLGAYVDNRNGEYYTSPPVPMNEEFYSLYKGGRYYPVWYVQSDIIKIKKNHGRTASRRPGSDRRNRQMLRQRTRTKLNRIGDIQMNSKIWKSL